MIQLNYRDARPIYEQIKSGLRKLVIAHVIDANEKLPSVRELATTLTINPNTIQRAYRELELEGYIYSVPGRGTFAVSREDIPDNRQKELLIQFDEIVSELLFLSIDADDLTVRVHNLAGGSSNL